MADEQKIVVEVPSERGHYSPVASTAKLSRLEEFKKGWRNAIAFPDNLPDLAFDLASWVAIPAMFMSYWVSLPIPGFIRWGVIGTLALSGVIACYLRQAIPEIGNILWVRLGLVALGLVLGS